MKKLAAAALALALALPLTGCADRPAPKDPGAKISVVSTIFAPYDFARAITGDRAQVTMLIPPAAESHSFEPKPQDIMKIRDCDVFIFVGGESDYWVEGILASMDTSGMRIVTLMDCVETLEEETVEGMQEEEGEEPGGPEYDEHVWTSPRNAKLIVAKISLALCRADQDNAAFYAANTASYTARLDELDAKLRGICENSTRKTVVFADRFPFRYFAAAYGLEYYAAFPGCSGETEANPRTIAFLIAKIKDDKIPVVFHIELNNKKMAESIAEATGAKVLELHSCHNISGPDFKAGRTYLQIMDANAEALREALN